MKNKKYHNVGKIPKFNRKVVERDKIDATKTHEHCPGLVQTLQ